MKIVALTGAGISAESGIKTFRDHDGLWEGHDVMEVATPEGWMKNPELVLDFYNQRRKQLISVNPNVGHLSLNQLQEKAELIIITQNVDNLHEKAGHNRVIHLHGELNKVRCEICSTVQNWSDDLTLQNKCECGGQLRPHIVWFGEAVPEIENAIHECKEADFAIIIGTSMQVYPAASLIGYVPKDCKIYYIDPKPTVNGELQFLADRLSIIQETASIGVPKVVQEILNSIP